MQVVGQKSMNYQKITKYDIANGEGVRVVLWVSGCNHHCEGCHNPETWDPTSGQLFTKETMDELLEALEPDYIAGLTLSGGDPLFPKNRETIYKILKTVHEKFPQKTIWLYTGYKWEEIQHNPWITAYTDVIVDGEFIMNQKDITLPWCGSKNQMVINVEKSVLQRKVVLYDR